MNKQWLTLQNDTLNLEKNKSKSNLSSTTLNLKHQTSSLKITPTPQKYS